MSGAEHAGDPVTTVARSVEATKQQYEGDTERPLRGYVGILAAYTATLAAFVGALRATGRRLPERFDGRDLALVAVATHKLARLVSKDPVTSPLRAPFTRFEGGAGPSELHEEVRGEGSKRAVGELLTCPFCVGQWIATAFAFGLVFQPRPTRVVASVLSTLAASDALQLAYARLQEQ